MTPTKQKNLAERSEVPTKARHPHSTVSLQRSSPALLSLEESGRWDTRLLNSGTARGGVNVASTGLPILEMALSSVGGCASTELRNEVDLKEAVGLSPSAIWASWQAIWPPRRTFSQKESSSSNLSGLPRILLMPSTFKGGKRGLNLRPCRGDFKHILGKNVGWGEGSGWTERPSLSRTASFLAFVALHSLSAHWVIAALLALSMSNILDSLVYWLPVCCGNKVQHNNWVTYNN